MQVHLEAYRDIKVLGQVRRCLPEQCADPPRSSSCSRQASKSMGEPDRSELIAIPASFAVTEVVFAAFNRQARPIRDHQDYRLGHGLIARRGVCILLLGCEVYFRYFGYFKELTKTMRRHHLWCRDIRDLRFISSQVTVPASSYRRRFGLAQLARAKLCTVFKYSTCCTAGSKTGCVNNADDSKSWAAPCRPVRR